MANKGTLKIDNEDYELMSEHTWWLMHSDPKAECEPIWQRTAWTKGGLCAYGYKHIQSHPFNANFKIP